MKGGVLYENPDERFDKHEEKEEEPQGLLTR